MRLANMSSENIRPSLPLKQVKSYHIISNKSMAISEYALAYPLKLDRIRKNMPCSFLIWPQISAKRFIPNYGCLRSCRALYHTSPNCRNNHRTALLQICTAALLHQSLRHRWGPFGGPRSVTQQQCHCVVTTFVVSYFHLNKKGYL